MRPTLIVKPPLGASLALGHPLTRGLVARFLFNEGAGTRLNNLADPLRPAILSNMDPATDWLASRGGALAFDGVDDVANAPGADTDGSRQISLLVWFRTSTTQTACLARLGVSPGSPFVAKLRLTPTNVLCDLSGTSVSVAATYADGRWHQLAMTFNGSNLGAEISQRLYFDGKLIGTATSPENGNVALDQVYIANDAGTGFALADIADLRAYRRALSAEEIAWLYADPYPDMHRPPAWGPDRAHGTRELEGFIDGDWRNLSQDFLLTPEVSIDYGIGGTGPQDRVAGAGRMAWAMNNSEENSAGLLGYYSPDNANLKPGFEVGIPIRFTYRGASGTVYRKHVGWLADVDPEPFILGERKTRCQSNDWMTEAGIFEPTGIGTQTDQTADQVASVLIAAIPRRPTATHFDAGKVVFPYALDNSRSEEQPILGELQRLAMSEWGYFSLHGDGSLHFENQERRLVPTVKATFSSKIADLSVGQSRPRIRNIVKVTVHPRRSDDNDNVVLYQLPTGKPPFIPAGGTLDINGRFNDPNNRQARIGGINMQALVPLTDYDMHQGPGGGGVSMADKFDVSVVFGANDAKFRIVSSARKGAFVTKLQARGRGLYDYDSYDVEARNEASIARYGPSEIKIDTPYLAEPLVAEAIANYVLGQWSRPITADASCSIIAVDPATIEDVLSIEPGDAIAIQETVTGINFVFFVQHISLRFPEADIVMAEFRLQRGPLSEYWTVGVASKSEVGVTTVVGPL